MPASGRGDTTPVLKLRGLGKHFAGVWALKGATLDLYPGEVHALVGENGAGKSTLVKLLSGVHRPDVGHLSIDGEHYDHLTPERSQALGIAIIYQEFNLVPTLPVLDNMYLGRELRGRLRMLDRNRMRLGAKRAFDRLGVRVDLDRRVSELSVAQRQMVEIAKALVHESRVIAMDEPSAVIAGRELEELYRVVRALAADGVTVVYISHRLEEVFTLADRITVLKDGEHVGTEPTASLTRADLVRMMVGRDVQELARRERAAGTPLLQVEGLRIHPGKPPISVTLHAGEVVGVAGMVGSGRSTLARTLAGVRKPAEGRILRRGEAVRLKNPAAAIGNGIVMIPEDRRGEGLLLPMTVGRNIALPSLRNLTKLGLVSGAREGQLAQRATAEFDIRPGNPGMTTRFLSGGNQQKVVVAKWLVLEPNPEVVILDEPTRGVDVGAKFEIYEIIRDIRARGGGVLMVSSELPEIVGMSDRVLVMSDGGVVGELTGDEISEESIMELVTG